MTAKRNEPGRVFLIVTGGIAVYKACDVVRELRHSSETVQVVLTRETTQFVTAMTFETLANRRVFTEILPGVTDGEIDHIRLGREANVVGVVPATANFIAKMHAGIADDLASATLLALPRTVPLLVAPAMNREMWSHPVTQRNLRELKELLAPRLHLLEPVEKELACGEFGPGGLPEPAAIAAAFRALMPARRANASG